MIAYRASRSLSQAAILSLEMFSSDILLAGINSALQLRATYTTGVIKMNREVI